MCQIIDELKNALEALDDSSKHTLRLLSDIDSNLDKIVAKARRAVAAKEAV